MLCISHSRRKLPLNLAGQTQFSSMLITAYHKKIDCSPLFCGKKPLAFVLLIASLFTCPITKPFLLSASTNHADLSGQRIIHPRSSSSNPRQKEPTDQKLRTFTLMCPRPSIEDKDRTAPPPPWSLPLDPLFRGAPTKQGIPKRRDPSFLHCKSLWRSLI